MIASYFPQFLTGNAVSSSVRLLSWPLFFVPFRLLTFFAFLPSGHTSGHFLARPRLLIFPFFTAVPGPRFCLALLLFYFYRSLPNLFHFPSLPRFTPATFLCRPTLEHSTPHQTVASNHLLSVNISFLLDNSVFLTDYPHSIIQDDRSRPELADAG